MHNEKITETDNQRMLELLSNTALDFVQFSLDDNIYEYIGKKLLGFLEDRAYIIINSVDYEVKESTVQAILGLGSLAEKLIHLIGRDPVGMTIDIEDSTPYYSDGKLHDFEEGIYGLSLKTIPRIVCASVEKLLGIHSIYLIDMAKREQFFGTIIIMTRDDTDLKNHQLIETFVKQASIAIQKRQAEIIMQKSEIRFRELFQNMSSGVVVFNAVDQGNDFTFADLNRAAETIGKVRKKEILGKRVTDIFPSIGSMETFDIYKRVWKSGVSEQCPVFEYKDDRISGWRDNYVYKLPTGELVSIFNDITERKKMEEQLIQTRKMESIGQLASGVAHNFNNILCGIMSAAQLLQSPQRDLDEQGRRYTEMILESSKRASELVEKLVAFGQRGRLPFARINLEEMLRDAVDLLYGTLLKNISLSINAENTEITGDYAALENTIINLCINAFHAIEEGGEIKITLENITLDPSYCDQNPQGIAPGAYCKIEIIDSGEGISPEILNRIFDPFFTTKEQGKGVGLGLSAIYGIVKDHHGEILVESELGQGTVFTLHLPCDFPSTEGKQ